MKLIRHVLMEKGHDVYSVPPELTVFDALKLMSEKDVGALLVKKDEKILGIFSERDYARKVILVGRSSRDIQISEIMSEKVFFIKPENSVEECMAVMPTRTLVSSKLWI